MALPYTFANVTELDTPQLDANFAAVAALGTIPCGCTGTNALTLTPAANTPTIAAYTNQAPVVSFIAANNSTNVVTVNVAGVGFKNLYKANGATQAGSGDLVQGYLYYAGYNSALNSNAGGFVLINPSFTATSSQFIQGSTSATVAAAGTVYLGVNGAQATEANTFGVVALPTGILSTIWVGVVSAPGAGSSFVYTVYHGGVSTAYGGTISGGSAFAATITPNLAVNLGDTLTLKLVTSATAPATDHRYFFQVDP